MSEDEGGDIAVAAAPIIDEGELVGVVRISRGVQTVQANVGRATAAIVAVALAVCSRDSPSRSRSPGRSPGRCHVWRRPPSASGQVICLRRAGKLEGGTEVDGASRVP